MIPATLSWPSQGSRVTVVSLMATVVVALSPLPAQLPAPLRPIIVLHRAPTHLGLNRPIFVAVDAAGTLYLADYNNRRVVTLSATGQVRGSWATGPHPPVGVAVDALRHVYVTSGAHIWTYTSSGHLRATWTIPVTHLGLTEVRPWLEGIAVGAGGDVYTWDHVGGMLITLSPRGTVLSRWAVARPVPPIIEPSSGGVAVDRLGHVYVVDRWGNRVVRLARTGDVLAVWGLTGPASRRFAGPTSVATDGQGDVYVGDSGHHRVVKLSPRGALLTQWRGAGSGWGAFRGNLFIATGPHDTLYIVDDTTNRITVVAPSGRIQAVWA